MEHFGLYLLKVSASIAAFYSLYYLLFRKEKQFAFNRIYLSSILVISFLIPLITLKTEVPIVQSLSPVLVNTVNESNFNNTQLTNQSVDVLKLDLWAIIKTVYLLACCFLFFRLIFGVVKVKQILWKGKTHVISGQEVIVTKKEICPFSSFNKIVIPENLLNSQDLAMIIMHEKVHIKEKHFIDLFLSEFLLLFLWFNPFSWFVNSAIRTNLEFSADNAVKNELYDLEEYQMAMVRLIDSKHISPLANALNVSQLKNRIMMMKRKKQNRYTVLKKLAVLPMLLTLILFLSAKQEVLIPINTGEQIYIKGKVTEMDGEKPIPWTTIHIKEKPILVTITDNNGGFVLPAEASSKRLVISSFGYYSKEIEISGRREIDIKLKRDDLIHEIVKPLNSMQGRNPRIDFDKQVVVADNQGNKIVVEGKIFGGDNGTSPVPLANVSVKGKASGVIADEQGNYSISVEPGDKYLIFSSFGHHSREIEIKNQTEIDVELRGIISISSSFSNPEKWESLMLEQLNKQHEGYVINGIVTSEKTKMPIHGVHVFIEGKPLGAITDDEGKYSIIVSRDDKELWFSGPVYSQDFEIYKRAKAKIKNEKDQINIELESSRTMQEVAIYPENTEQISINGIDASIIESEPNNYRDKIIIKGKVTETGSNKPIPGVGVVVKGTTIGAITDKEGNYIISFPNENNVLVFALMGYKLKEAEINGRKEVNVALEKDESVVKNQISAEPQLGEIVLKGKVTEGDSEEALGGVSVIIKGKPTGTMTDINGNYQIHVSKDDNKLVFISPDYQTQEIDIDEIKVIDVKLIKK